MDLEPKVVYENNDFLILDKPSGLQVHPARIAANRLRKREATEYPEKTLVDWLVDHYPEVKTVGDDPATRPGIVHRLDKETSGIMVVPRNQKTFEMLKSLFQKHVMQKTYLALVFGILKNHEGIIDAPIGIKTGTLKRSVHAKKMVKPAVTEYKVLRELHNAFSLLEVKPKTGRTHQIRVHLASIGHPIVGDAMYGNKKQPPSAHRLMLHAKSLIFNDDHGNQFEFEADPPKEFKDFEISTG
jgi:23S rRNA pseudouridine1911/1915/1917 synthase